MLNEVVPSQVCVTLPVLRVRYSQSVTVPQGANEWEVSGSPLQAAPGSRVHIIQNFKVYRTDPSCGCSRVIDEKLERRVVYGYPEQLPERLEVNADVKVHQIAPSVPIWAKVDLMEDDR